MSQFFSKCSHKKFVHSLFLYIVYLGYKIFDIKVEYSENNTYVPGLTQKLSRKITHKFSKNRTTLMYKYSKQMSIQRFKVHRWVSENMEEFI